MQVTSHLDCSDSDQFVSHYNWRAETSSSSSTSLAMELSQVRQNKEQKMVTIETLWLSSLQCNENHASLALFYCKVDGAIAVENLLI